jgi:hypothetical protein
VESEYVEELLASHCESSLRLIWKNLFLRRKSKLEKENEVKDAAPRELPTSLLYSILREAEK